MFRNNCFVCFLALFLMLHAPQALKAEWCEAKKQTEPAVLKTFKYAVDVFENGAESTSVDSELDESIDFLVSSYSFFLHKEDLNTLSTQTLRNILRVIRVLKSEDRVFQHPDLEKIKNEYLRMEEDIVKIIECRIVVSRNKVRHILK